MQKRAGGHQQCPGGGYSLGSAVRPRMPRLLSTSPSLEDAGDVSGVDTRNARGSTLESGRGRGKEPPDEIWESGKQESRKAGKLKSGVGKKREMGWPAPRCPSPPIQEIAPTLVRPAGQLARQLCRATLVSSVLRAARTPSSSVSSRNVTPSLSSEKRGKGGRYVSPFILCGYRHLNLVDASALLAVAFAIPANIGAVPHRQHTIK